MRSLGMPRSTTFSTVVSSRGRVLEQVSIVEDGVFVTGEKALNLRRAAISKNPYLRPAGDG